MLIWFSFRLNIKKKKIYLTDDENQTSSLVLNQIAGIYININQQNRRCGHKLSLRDHKQTTVGVIVEDLKQLKIMVRFGA